MPSTQSPSAAQSHHFAEIPLPPGLTLEQFQSLQGSLVKVAIAVTVAFGILIWDYANLLPEELKLYRRGHKKIWRSSVTWMFVVIRYSGILATLPALFFTSLQSDHCEAAVVSSQVGAVIVVASSGYAFYIRVMTMWEGYAIVSLGTGFLYIVMLGCWCAVASQSRVETGSATAFGSNCQVSPPVSWTPIASSSSVAFDAVIVLLTIFKPTEGTNAGHSLLYFLITMTGNITALVIQALGHRFDLLKSTTQPFSVLIMATMGARVILDLMLFNMRQSLWGAKGLPFTFGHTPRPSRVSKPPQPVSSSRRESGTYPISLTVLNGAMQRPDTPFASYDYDSPKVEESFDKRFETAFITRETVVTVE